MVKQLELFPMAKENSINLSNYWQLDRFIDTKYRTARQAKNAYQSFITKIEPRERERYNNVLILHIKDKEVLGQIVCRITRNGKIYFSTCQNMQYLKKL